MRPPTAILIHGYNVWAPDWVHVVWGKPREGVLGRASRGLELSYKEFFADLIYWGGAGSERDGKKESEITFECSVECIKDLPEFALYNHQQIQRLVVDRSYIDTKAKNTYEEIVNCGRECTARGISRMILVSSPSHFSRCGQIAEELRATGKLGSAREIFATSSHTYWEGAGPGDTVIFEPPCPSMLKKHPLHKHVRPILDIPRDRVPDFVTELDKLVAKYV